ncbi:hypothetical protein PanWU01x14_039980 [Parasponia andersonii]|uniref:Uncharacterized protein n=1 Tax=Parasponia andersonii TaxID=3476 RepID=A0A2P5DR26_PARAD|nr:hypothetical protein PanWU01x14_039980 [Parasponia andersonii]
MGTTIAHGETESERERLRRRDHKIGLSDGQRRGYWVLGFEEKGCCNGERNISIEGGGGERREEKRKREREKKKKKKQQQQQQGWQKQSDTAWIDNGVREKRPIMRDYRRFGTMF